MAVALSISVGLLGCLLGPASRVTAATPAMMSAAPVQAPCTSTVGPGIPPPPSVPSGIPGFHAHWYGQSGYPTLCAGERSTATVAFYNSGSLGWVRGRMGEMAFLGTWAPFPGQDQPSALGGDGTAGSPNTGWPRFNRIAAQPADYVGPGQIAWFQFTIQAPMIQGFHVLYLRPLIEGATWMEDFGVFWLVSVKGGSGEVIPVTPTSEGDAELGSTREYTATGTGEGCVDLAFVDAPGLNFEGMLRRTAGGAAILSSAATFTMVNGASTTGSYVDCVTPQPGQVVTFRVTSSTANAYVHPVMFRDLNGNNVFDSGQPEPWGIGGPVRFVPPEAATGSHTVTVGIVSTARDYFTEGAAATYRYDANDTFQRAGVTLGLAQFEQVISRADTVAVSYQSDEGASSVFNITTDRGREAPTVVARVDSWDLGPTQNDVGLLITEPPTNMEMIGYSIQRARTGVGTGCDASAGRYDELTMTAIDVEGTTDSLTYIDRDVAMGAYCYRVGTTDPFNGTTAFGYSQRVTINNPPTPVAPPRALDARVTTSAGSPSVLDAGDVIKIAFDKEMQSPVGRQMRVQDADGTVADIRCLLMEQDCALNPGLETLGGVTYAANTVVTITMRTNGLAVTPGSAAGLQLNLTITSGDFPDYAGNTWDVPGSSDLVLGAPD